MTTRAATRFKSTHGFTLVEMAVVLFILGLMIAGILGPVETQLEARDRQQTIDTMTAIIEALYGYAISHGRLPCPDTDGDGFPDTAVEPYSAGDPDTGLCDPVPSVGEGFVPWAELNVPAGDAWGNRFSYRVRSPNFTWPESDPPALLSDRVCDGDDAPEEFDLCATGNIQILTRGATVGAGKDSSTLANNLPAVVISHGRNGFGATSVAGAARPLATSGTDEYANSDGDLVFFSRGYTRGGAACDDASNESAPLCAFDDIVMWVSPAILNNRMVTSGRLP